MCFAEFTTSKEFNIGISTDNVNFTRHRYLTFTGIKNNVAELIRIFANLRRFCQLDVRSCSGLWKHSEFFRSTIIIVICIREGDTCHKLYLTFCCRHPIGRNDGLCEFRSPKDFGVSNLFIVNIKLNVKNIVKRGSRILKGSTQSDGFANAWCRG